MPDETYGTRGYPLCRKCGKDRRVDHGAFPGLCPECITRLSNGDRARALAEHGHAPGDAPAAY